LPLEGSAGTNRLVWVAAADEHARCKPELIEIASTLAVLMGDRIEPEHVSARGDGDQ
jgi:hypothetical protein